MDGNKNKMIEFFFNTVYLVSGVTMRQGDMRVFDDV